MRSATAITFLYVSLGVSPLLAQTYPACGGEHHYRWAQKAETSLVAVAVELGDARVDGLDLVRLTSR